MPFCFSAQETALHDDFLSKWGLEHATVALPTTTLYTSYLLRVCATRPHAEGLAALLPCFWVYMHVGQVMLKRREELPADASRPEEFDKWIDMYAGDGYEKTVTQYRKLVEDAAAAADEPTRAAMTAHFKKGCELEFMFWTAAQEEQGWPSF